MVLGPLWILAAQAAAAGAADEPVPEDPQDPQEVIVTGERVKRSVKDTASSVAVVTARDLETQPVDRVEQVLASIPNVQLGSGSEGPAIRGLDTTGALQALPAFLGGNRPRTTIVVDGRAATYNEFVFGVEPVWDVERIEVFRSPQTTTQGQNSIAGAIFVQTADPTFEPEAKVRLLAGDFHTRQASVAASAPVNSDIAVRVAGDVRYSRTTSRIADRAEGADPNHDVYGLARVKLLAEPSALPGTRVTLTYSHQKSQAPQVVQVTEPFRERRDESGFYGTFRIRVDSLTTAIRHQSGDVIINLLATAGDSLAQRLAFPGLGQSRIEGRDWSSEAVVQWAPDGPLEMVGGVSRKHLALKQRIDLSVLNGMPHFRDRQIGTGVFGEARLRFAPKATLTAGLRYQRDRQRRIGAFGTATGSIDLDYDRTFDAWLPKVSLAYDLTDRVTAGVLIQKAYNPGGTTLRFDIAQPDNFEAERLWDYEAFVRGSTMGGRLRFAANIFYYDMRDAQRAKSILIPSPAGFPVGFADLFNVPKAHSYGAEAEVEWRPSGRLSARAGLGVLRTKIVEAGADYPQFHGNEFERSPHLSGSAAIDWRPIDRLTLSAQARHHSAYWSDPANGPLTRVRGGTIADARAEYRLHRLSLFAYARNLFDTFSMTSHFGAFATLEDPRQVGIGAETRF